MSQPYSFFKSVLVVVFACSTLPAFAQRGGGGGHMGGGGGFHGGGGFGGFHGGGSFHGGGGMRSGGGPRGGFSAPPAGYGAPRGSAPSPLRSGGGFVARPGNQNNSPQGGNFAGGNQRFGNSVAAPPAPRDGQWHSFGVPTAGHGPSSAPSAAGPSSGSNLHVLSGGRGVGQTGPVRSFAGQGGEVWETTPAVRNVVPRSQSLSTLHSSFTGSLATHSVLRSNGPFLASSRFAGGSSLLANRGFSAGANASGSFQQLRSFNRFGVPFDRFGRFGRGCWNCGFGFGGWGGWGWGFGWGGWGWPWAGFWGWSPFWVDPWWGWGFGWSAPASAYSGYPASNVYIYNNSSDSGNYTPSDNSSTPSQPEDSSGSYNQDNSQGNWVTPNGPSPSLAPNESNLTVPVLIYMKSGSILSVRDYWMLDGELHYILMNGVQKSVDLEMVDLPRTNTENAKSGVKFLFKSAPSVPPSAPDASPAPPAEPNADQPGGVAQPDART
jgi:hypothetical protein